MRLIWFSVHGSVLLLLALSFCGVAWAATPFFQDSFDNGLRTNANGFAWTSAGGRVTVNTTAAYSGQYALQFRFGPDADLADSNAEQRFNFGRNLTEVWVEYFFRTPENYEHRFQTSGAMNNKFIRIWGNEYASANKVGASTFRTTDTESLLGHEYNFKAWSVGTLGRGPVGNRSAGIAVPRFQDRGQWRQIRMHFKLVSAPDADDGEYRLWIDGTLVDNFTRIPQLYDTQKPFWNQGYLMGWSNSGFANLTLFQIDDVKFYDTNPGWDQGLPPADATPPVAQVTTPTQGRLFPANRSSVLAAVSTNEIATCRWSLTNITYSTMPANQTLLGINSSYHTLNISGLLPNSTVTRFVRCSDPTGNSMSTSALISFRTATPWEIQGDTNGDGVVNAQDFVFVMRHFRKQSGYDAWSDRNSDGVISLRDLVLVGQDWGLLVDSAVCGNGVREIGEACDSGIQNGVCPSTCSAVCTAQVCAPIDTTPPVATVLAPSANQQLPAETTSTPLTVTTNELATCRWSAQNQEYESMPNSLSGAGTTAHSGTFTQLSNGQSYVRYVRCEDNSGNAMATSVTAQFSVANTQGVSSLQKLDWPLEVLSWNLEKAYPGVLYNTRMGIKGGEFPYTFRLLNAPQGMSIDERRGEITWLPLVEQAQTAVTVEVTDSKGATITHSFPISVTKAGFVFIAPNGTDGPTADGTFEKPWRTIAYVSAAERGLPTDTAVFVRAGTYAEQLVIRSTNAAPRVWLAWPGERPIIEGTGGVVSPISTSATDRVLIQGFEIRNAGPANGGKMFWVSGSAANIVWRNNLMHSITSTGTGNPSFIFTEDSSTRFSTYQNRTYNRLVVQDNVMHGLRNDVAHGGAVVLYNVQNMLFENNLVYDTDGMCLMDKDDGLYNTFRGNVIHTCGLGGNSVGIGLSNQYTQVGTDVSHNLIYNTTVGVVIGWQPGYIRDIYVHHNTFINTSIRFRWVLNGSGSENINVYRNLFVPTGRVPYSASEPAADAALNRGIIRIDENLISPTTTVYSGNNNQRNLNWTAWQSAGHDSNGLFVNPGLVDFELPHNSPYSGQYGHS